MQFTSAFNIGDRVTIDGAADIRACVTALLWRENRMEFEVSWFANGSLQSAWVGESRLRIVSED